MRGVRARRAMVSHVGGADGDSSRTRWGFEINDNSQLELTRQQRVVKVMMQILSTSKLLIAKSFRQTPHNLQAPRLVVLEVIHM